MLTTIPHGFSNKINLKEVIWIVFAGSCMVLASCAYWYDKNLSMQIPCGIFCYLGFCWSAYMLGKHFAFTNATYLIIKKEYPVIIRLHIYEIICLSLSILIIIVSKNVLSFGVSIIILIFSASYSFLIGRHHKVSKEDIETGPDDSFSEYPSEDLPNLSFKLSLIPIFGILFFYLLAIPALISILLYRITGVKKLLLGLLISCINIGFSYYAITMFLKLWKHVTI